MKPENYPQTIYKYRDWNDKFHKKILTENQLFLASPNSFNDPIDCRISKNYSLLDTDEKMIEYSEIITEKLKYEILKRGFKPEEEKLRILKELKTDLKSFQENDDENTFAIQDKHIGVLSMSARYDSILMWSHYADYHKGFCVGFDEDKMRNAKLFGKGGPISYTTKFPQIDPRDERTIETSFLQTHRKAKDWEYEKEYRLTKLFFPNEPTLNDRKVSFPNDFIKEIILGLKISNEHKEEIVAIAREKNIEVSQIFQYPYQFKLGKSTV